ncbi:cellulose binding domain-containing protein [Streptosporangium sp. DT93]|uniref:cellulose binding domain-containing protein n=1 Tax=Streptosporangium sp. DT93 TaxID=3393428 RepID=UPI003CF2EFCB
MPPTMKMTSLLGLVSLTAAAALLGAACAGRTAESGHAGAHAPSPFAQSTATPDAAPPSGTARNAAQATTSDAAPSDAAPSSSAAGDPTHTINPVAAKCRATVTLVETWPGGYRGTATISNKGDRPLGGWYIQWMMPLEATITQAWQGTHMKSGPVAMIHALPEAAPLAPGKTLSEIGFIGVASTPPAFTEITCG